jgi:dihydrofolate synthase/folylpolyglutamate synthase
MTVGMAFSYFENEAVDIAVIEVGMGGRLDGTNIITPEVSLITNIGLDHTEFLGETLAEIAGEKAGIIKPQIPVVISETQPETEPVFRAVAKAQNAPIQFADAQDYPEFRTSLLGDYQRKNQKGVRAVLAALKNFNIQTEQIQNGFLRVTENTGLLGRWQELQSSPRVICDTAHNREGLELVFQQLLRQPYRRLHLVLGFVKEKKLDQLLPLFPKQAQYYLSRPDIPRGMDLDLLEQFFKSGGFSYSRFNRIDEAYSAALAEAAPDDLIFIGGSTFTVAEVV